VPAVVAPHGRHIKLAAAIAIALVFAGCDSSEKTQTATAMRTTSTTSAAENKHAHAPTGRGNKKASNHATKTGRPTKPAGVLPKLSPSRHTKLARAATLVALAGAGFSQPDIAVVGNGTAVTISVPKVPACSAAPGEKGRLESQIRRTVPFVRNVTINVSGTGQSLSNYVTAHCSVGTLPSGPGHVVYSSSGRRMTTTHAFTVRSKRWTLVYENDSRFLAVFVLKQGKIQQAANATKRGTGSAVFKGAGTYQLRISGSGRWTVRVRDGA
jgi:hypothetical protein